MKSTRVKIATAVSLLALGGLAGVAITSSMGSGATQEVATLEPKVKTEVIRKTIRKTKKAPAAPVAAGSGSYAATAAPSGYAASTYSASAPSTSSASSSYSEPVTTQQSGSGGSGYSDDDSYEDDYEGYEGEDEGEEYEGEDD
jgi:hypothetical protein